MAVKSEIVESIQIARQRLNASLKSILKLFGLRKSTYYGWFDKNGHLKALPEKKLRNEKQITPEEVAQVLIYRKRHPDVGYRKLTWMMVDENVAYLSESAVYKVLSEHGLLSGWNKTDASGVEKEYRNRPKHVHHHWHIDIAYIKIRHNFYFLIMLLDGYSRYLLAWELMPDMLGSSVETFVQKAKEKYPHVKPILINDNGAQFISLDFKRLLSRLQIQQVFSRRNHPQTNGKIERLNGTVRKEAIRPNCPMSYQEACEVLNEYAYIYNYQRLHAGINYLRPADMFFGRGMDILKERREKIILARKRRIEENRARKTVSYFSEEKVRIF